MIEIDVLIRFFGWCTVINLGVLLFSTIMLLLLKDQMVAVHSKLFGLSSATLAAIYFRYLAYYKVAIFIFNLVPYLALTLMS